MIVQLTESDTDSISFSFKNNEVVSKKRPWVKNYRVSATSNNARHLKLRKELVVLKRSNLFSLGSLRLFRLEFHTLKRSQTLWKDVTWLWLCQVHHGISRSVKWKSMGTAPLQVRPKNKIYIHHKTIGNQLLLWCFFRREPGPPRKSHTIVTVRTWHCIQRHRRESWQQVGRWLLHSHQERHQPLVATGFTQNAQSVFCQRNQHGLRAWTTQRGRDSNWRFAWEQWQWQPQVGHFTLLILNPSLLNLRLCSI